MVSVGRITAMISTLVAMVLIFPGCGGGSGSSASPPAIAGQALVVGDADGEVFETVKSTYGVAHGSGKEDPTRFATLVFDGNHTTPDQIAANAGVKKFLFAGKPVMILNNTEGHRKALGGAVWAHAEGSSPGVAVLIVHDQTGVAQQLVQVDFPLRIQAAPPPQTPVLLKPISSELTSDGFAWLKHVTAMSSGAGSIGPANTGPGQTVMSFDEVQPCEITVQTILTGQPPPQDISWQTPPAATTSVNCSFETLAYALLEGSSPATYQHKIIARQYLLVSPPSPIPLIPATTEQGSVIDTWLVNSYLGFNNSFGLQLELSNAPALGVIEFMPTATNNVNH